MMPRAKRLYAPGDVLHITHRCHKKEFLLKFKRDRDRYRYWLFEAKRRYGFCVINYMITSNHIHLLVNYSSLKSLSQSMQLVASRTAQEYNIRKKRKGAFWEDRYHVSIIEGEDYLQRCYMYIDLNMVRTGKVRHPIEWEHSGYYELFHGRERYQVLAITKMLNLLGYNSLEDFKKGYSKLIYQALQSDKLLREPLWTEQKIIGSSHIY
jgi:putative transposase